jgi:hypothetical protein
MKKLILYFKQIFRLTRSQAKKEEIVWNDLKKLHTKNNWRAGFYEREKYIETSFEIAEDVPADFYFLLYDSCFHCRVKILEEISPDLTTEMFILASHFNNHLRNGVVIVNVSSEYIEYHLKTDLMVPLLNPDEILLQITRHFNTSKDIYLAFQRLITEQEAPAIIFADILKKNESEDDAQG